MVRLFSQAKLACACAARGGVCGRACACARHARARETALGMRISGAVWRVRSFYGKRVKQWRLAAIVARAPAQCRGRKGPMPGLIQSLTSLDNVQRHHLGCGGHFFDKGALRFFRSRIGPWIGCTEDERTAVFLTSEMFEDSHGNRAPRMYTIRVYTLKKAGANAWSIEEPYGFQAFSSLKRARSQAQCVLIQLRRDKPTDVGEYVRANYPERKGPSNG